MKLSDAMEKGWKLGQAAGVEHSRGSYTRSDANSDVCSACAMGFAVFGVLGEVVSDDGHTEDIEDFDTIITAQQTWGDHHSHVIRLNDRFVGLPSEDRYRTMEEIIAEVKREEDE